MSNDNGINLAIVGATGAVGEEFLRVLKERDFPIKNLRLMASARSAGKKLSYSGSEYEIEDLATADPTGIDIALFSAGGSITKEHAPRFADSGAVVVDNSSAFRMDSDVPLVIPEINPQEAANRPRGIIANPNCSTIIALVPLWPLHKKATLKRAVISTYQAVSGAGARALVELEEQTRSYLAGEEVKPEMFPHPIAFNLFSHDSEVGADGFNVEETKMINETKKIFADDNVAMTATCVRVPTFRSHAESINAEFENEITPEEATDILAYADGVKLVDEPENNRFPMPLETSGQDLVYVGRIRRDPTAKNALAMFVSGDQLRKGAATNAVQIAELVVRERGN